MSAGVSVGQQPRELAEGSRQLSSPAKALV